ncbi:MAG: hypothetical protein K0R54_549 [Clostridiaceae bacterium]|jgi:hypothetical protein|nr:hypothetical protein [Clostridiaceae bacterium]
MSVLEGYAIKDSETQYDIKWGDCKDMLYEIYGITESGVLFERDLNNPNRILRHYSNGIKGIDYNMSREEVFFRKVDGDIRFFTSHKDYDDYNYSEEPKQLSKEEMIKVLKEYVYLHFPNIGNRTMMGWSREDGDTSPIHDTNWCYVLVQLDDKKDYTIIKRKDTVKLFEGDVNMYYFDNHDELAVVKFTLERELYEKAIKLYSLRRRIARRMFGKINVSTLKEFIDLEAEITANFKNVLYTPFRG